MLGAVLVAVVSVVGCGGTPPGGGGPGSTPPSGEITVSGVVVAGVEAGCLLLDTGTMRYLLLGGDRSLLEPGRRVEVHGTPQPDTVTYCMQGMPLRVAEVRPAA